MSISKINQGMVVVNAVPAIKSENPYVMALVDSRPMYQLTVFERKTYLLGCISAAIFIGGWKPKSDNELILIVGALLPDINSRFKEFTESEVKSAFEMGAKGYLSENNGGMSVAACIAWLTAYQFHPERQNARKRLSKANPDPKPLPSSRGQQRLLVQNAYDKFLGDPSRNVPGIMTYDYGNLLYSLLDKEGMITYTPAEKKAFVERGRTVLFARLQVANSLQERADNQRKIDQMMESDSDAIREGMRVALEEYFTGLKALGTKNIAWLNTCLKFNLK